jgi:hypothetical protein
MSHPGVTHVKVALKYKARHRHDIMVFKFIVKLLVSTRNTLKSHAMAAKSLHMPLEAAM